MAVFNTLWPILTLGVLWILLPIGGLLYFVLCSIYRISFHPLRRIPGPHWAKSSSLWLWYHNYRGNQLTAVHKLHNLYGPIVQIAPNLIDISKSDALGPIYIDRGGFDKSYFYKLFYLDGYAPIFSTPTLAGRSTRVKAILPLFSTAAVREFSGIISECAQSMANRMITASKTGRPVNMMTHGRSFAFDALSSNLFKQSYGCLEEKSTELCISPFLDYITDLARFYYMSESLFLGLGRLIHFLPLNHKTIESFKNLNNFVESCVENAKAGADSFPSRLLALNLSVSQTTAECVDVTYAGTESTGNILARICWYLVAYPEKYKRLRNEINQTTAVGYNLHTVPYLNGVVKEALRLSMITSVNLPRRVPPQGWNYAGYHIPADTNVGVSAFELHLNPAVFPDPDEFLPERWLSTTAEMNTHFAPFGKGARSCIARTLANTELLIATEAIVSSDVLRGAERVQNKIEIYEWFNAKFKAGKLELIWPNEKP